MEGGGTKVIFDFLSPLSPSFLRVPFFRKKAPEGYSSLESRSGSRLRGLISHLSSKKTCHLCQPVYQWNISDIEFPSTDSTNYQPIPHSTDYQPIPHSISAHVSILLGFEEYTYVPILLRNTQTFTWNSIRKKVNLSYVLGILDHKVVSIIVKTKLNVRRRSR